MRSVVALLLVGLVLPCVLACEDEGEEPFEGEEVARYDPGAAAPAELEDEGDAARIDASSMDRGLEETGQALRDARDASEQDWERSRQEIDEILSDLEMQLSQAPAEERR